jgi:hypothetical protein
MLSLLVCALYWPNPLVWLAARSLRNEAEVAADDQVIASGMRPSSYAGELLQLASEFRSRQPALAGMPLFMAAPSALEARVKSVLAPTQMRSGVTSMDVLKIGGIAIMAAAALTFARPSFAQEEATPPAPAAPAVESAPLPAVAQTAPVPPVAPNPVTAPDPVTPVAEVDSVHPTIRIRRSEHTVHGHKVRHIEMDVDTRGATAEELERMRPEIARAEAEVRNAQPQIARAEAEAHRAQAEIRAHETEIRAMRDAGPRIEAEVQAALAKAQPEIDRAIAEARRENLDLKISEEVNNAFKHARVRIEMKDHKAAPEETKDDEAPDAN